jgi:hypothetical protein
MTSLQEGRRGVRGVVDVVQCPLLIVPQFTGRFKLSLKPCAGLPKGSYDQSDEGLDPSFCCNVSRNDCLQHKYLHVSSLSDAKSRSISTRPDVH